MNFINVNVMIIVCLLSMSLSVFALADAPCGEGVEGRYHANVAGL